MRRKDWAIVACILAVALVAGLVTVNRALRQARQKQEESLLASQAAEAWARADSSSASSSAGDAAASSAAAGTQEATAGASGTAGAQSSAGGEDATGAQSSAGSGGTSAAAAQTDVDVPSLGSGAYTLSELTAWMQTKSGGALAAEAQLAAEKALASGTGTGDDAARRTFAQSQWANNDAARRNLLEEEALGLGTEYLRCRDLLALQTENVSFCQTLSAAVQAALKADDGTDSAKTALLQADEKTASAALEAAESARAAAQSELESAAAALNAAAGNDASTEISVTGALSRDTLSPDDAASAAAQAVASRNEIKDADNTAAREQQTLTKLRYQYPVTAPEYLNQQAAVQTAKTAAAKARATVESDLRTRCADLTAESKALDLVDRQLKETGTAEPKTAYAAEAESSNLAELETQWTQIVDLRQQQITQTAQLNEELGAYRHAVGVGCTAAQI